jgi:putative tryptophan/tyrosine transport system substrate-binding protein
MPDLATDLVRRRVPVTAALTSLRHLRRPRASLLVFMVAGDPIAFGVVGSLSRPQGNITGVFNLTD